MNEKFKASSGDKLKAQLEPVIAQINELTQVQRILIVIGTLLVLGGAFFYFFYLPKVDMIQQQAGQIQRTEDRLRKARQTARNLKAVEEKKATLEMAFKKVMRALPEKKEIPGLLAGISEAGKESGLEFLLFKPENESRKEFYAEIPVSVEVVGGFHETVSFFDRLSRMSRIVNVRDVGMNAQKVKDGHVGLQTKCKVVTYRFVEPAKDDGKKKRRRRRK